MIDWYGVGAGALWILGLALLLATLSFADWWARRNGVSWLAAARRPRSLASSGLALALIAAARFMESGSVLTAAFWAVLCVLLVAQSALMLWGSSGR